MATVELVSDLVVRVKGPESMLVMSGSMLVEIDPKFQYSVIAMVAESVVDVANTSNATIKL